MKTLLLCSVGSIALTSLAMAAPTPGATGQLGKRCGECHAIPPGTGPDEGRFKPGSHAEHSKFTCDRCHPTGVSDTTEEHVNGTISIKPEIEYQYGSEVPWPSMGSGTCGGLGYAYQLKGCHEQMPDAKCFWVPGKKCQPPE